jgi:hypothetical protein
MPSRLTDRPPTASGERLLAIALIALLILAFAVTITR